MNAGKQEFVSALLDDEAGAFERRRMLDELRQDEALGQTFSRYALIGEVMRSNGRPAVARKDFLAGIQDGLDEEPAYTGNVVDWVSAAEATGKVAVPASQPVVAKPATAKPARFKYGMAAAVAIAALVGGVVLVQQPQTTAPLTTATAVAPEKVQAPQAPVALQTAQAPAALVPVRSSGQLDPQTRDVLKQYVAQHVKYASTTAIVPSVRAVSYSNDY